MTIAVSPEAEADFLAVLNQLGKRNPSTATALADRIFSVIDQLDMTASCLLDAPIRRAGAKSDL